MEALIFIAAIAAVVFGWRRHTQENESVAEGCLGGVALLIILGMIGGLLALVAAGPGAVIGFLIVLFFISLIFTALTGIK